MDGRDNTPRSIMSLMAAMRSAPEDGARMLGYFRQLTQGGVKMHYDILQHVGQQGGHHGHHQGSRVHPLTKCKDARLILTFDKSHQGAKLPIHRLVNGVIVKYPEWKVLSVMPNLLETQYNRNDITKNISQYNVYPLQDGTMINLYFDDEWRFATCNSRDVRDYTWLGEKSYKQAAAELFNRYPEFSYEKLDKNHCYTLQFKHPHFHPFGGDASQILHVRTVRLNGLTPVDMNIGLPTLDAIAHPVDVFKDIDDAINAYKRNRTICYGFVLRSKDPNNPTDYIIESQLMTYIRKVIYDLPRSEIGQLNTVIRRIDYICLRAYMIADFKKHFLAIFPQYDELFKQFDQVFEEICDNIVKFHSSAKKDADGDPVKSVSLMLYEQIASVQININSVACRSIIMDHIKNPDNLNIMFIDYVCAERARRPVA